MHQGGVYEILVKLLESLDGMSKTEQVDGCYNGADEEVTVGITTNSSGDRGTVNPPTKTPALTRTSSGATGGVQGQEQHRRAAAVTRAADTVC